MRERKKNLSSLKRKPRIAYLHYREKPYGSAYKYARLLGTLSVLRRFKAGDGRDEERLRRFEPDLILCRGDWRQIYKTALRLRIPYLLIEHDVATLRDGGTVKEQRNEREMIENASGMILPSEDLIPYLASRYVLPPYRVIHLRPSGEDINFQPSRRKLLGLNLVYAGGLARRSRRRNRSGKWSGR